MDWLHLVSCFFGGAFLTNALPHFVAGVMGQSFQTPFAKPPGEAHSSSTVNVLWGFLNLVVGYGLIERVGAFDPQSNADAAAAALGILLVGLLNARAFGRFNGGNSAGGI